MIDIIVNLRLSHLLDRMYERAFRCESGGYDHGNLIALFPKKGALPCSKIDIEIEEEDVGFRTEDVDIKTMNYGRTLDQGRFKDFPEVARAIRRAARYVARYGGVTKNAMIVLRKMVPFEAREWRKVEIRLHKVDDDSEVEDN